MFEKCAAKYVSFWDPSSHEPALSKRLKPLQRDDMYHAIFVQICSLILSSKMPFFGFTVAAPLSQVLHNPGCNCAQP